MTLSATRREPGVYHEYVFLKEQGWLDALAQKVMLVGEMSAAGAAGVGVPIQVLSIAQGDTLFGAGSVLALMVRKAFAMLGYRDSIPQVWATPVAEPSGVGTAMAVSTLTIAGTAQTIGVLEVAIADVTLRISVTAGMTETAIAQAMAEEISSRAAELPCTASVAGAVVTCSAVCSGVNGNDIAYKVEGRGVDGVTVTVAQTTQGAGEIDLVPVLDGIGQGYQGWAFANHGTADVMAVTEHLALGWAIDGGADCGWGFLATTESMGVAQSLAAAANKIQTVMVACTGSPSTPWQIAACVATLAFSADAPNHNFDDAELPIAAPPEALAYQSGPEMESLLEAGVTPLARSRTQPTIARVVKLQTTRVLNAAGDADDTQTDFIVGRVAAYLAEQKQRVVRRLFSGKTLTEDTVEGIRDALLGVHFAAYRAGFIDEPNVAAVSAAMDPQAPGRLVSTGEHAPIFPLHQLYLIHESQI